MGASTIKELEERANALKEELRKVTDELWKAKCDACPIKVGDVVTYTGRAGTNFKVTRIRNAEWVWVDAVPQTKAGNWSKRPLRFYGGIKKVEA